MSQHSWAAVFVLKSRVNSLSWINLIFHHKQSTNLFDCISGELMLMYKQSQSQGSGNQSIGDDRIVTASGNQWMKYHEWNYWHWEWLNACLAWLTPIARCLQVRSSIPKAGASCNTEQKLYINSFGDYYYGDILDRIESILS